MTKKQISRKSNSELVKTIDELKRASRENDAPIWKSIAKKLEGPNRNWPVVNVSKIEYFQSQPWPFLASLMLGFFAETKDTELNVDKDEIEDANWFDISQLKDLTHPEITDGFKLPRFDSIARRLVNDWIRRHE